MANALTNFPMVIDTDITTWRAAASVVSAGYTTGIRVQKLMLVVGSGGASAAGSVTIESVSDSSMLYPPIVVGAATAASTIILNDNMADPKSNLMWRDFKVTGLTATGTVLYLWWTQ